MTLDGNIFERNQAKNKGGALRYLHKNFTTVYESRQDGRRILSHRALAGETDLIDTNQYISNSAFYAPDIASIPAFFKYRLL